MAAESPAAGPERAGTSPIHLPYRVFQGGRATWSTGTAFDGNDTEPSRWGRAIKEADVDERSRVLAATFAGAVIGGVWGWLYLTENGRRIRDQIEPKLDDLLGEITRVRGTVEKARTAANEGWRSLSEMTGGAASGGRWSA
jgi:hypothetical protein